MEKSFEKVNYARLDENNYHSFTDNSMPS